MSASSMLIAALSYNLTKVECKDNETDASWTFPASYNLTKVECKVNMGIEGKAKGAVII